MDKIQKPSNSERYTLSWEPLIFYVFFYVPIPLRRKEVCETKQFPISHSILLRPYYLPEHTVSAVSQFTHPVVFHHVTNLAFHTRTNQQARLLLCPHCELPYRVFQKDIYNVESLYRCVLRIWTVLWTVIFYQNTPSFIWDSYGPMWLPLVM
jgi:hypothetical protein